MNLSSNLIPKKKFEKALRIGGSFEKVLKNYCKLRRQIYNKKNLKNIMKIMELVNI